METNNYCEKNKKSEMNYPEMFNLEQWTHSGVLNEIAEDTRNNILNVSETAHFQNDFKVFNNSQFNNEMSMQNISMPVKNENDDYNSAHSDDEENIFSCKVELIEEKDNFVCHEIKPLNCELNLKQDEHFSIQQTDQTFYEVPKIHLKTVDEINRKCVVDEVDRKGAETKYLDVVKKRRQETNRRYYLKRKEQMEQQRNAMGLPTKKNNNKKETNQLPVHENNTKLVTENPKAFNEEPIKITELVNCNEKPLDNDPGFILTVANKNNMNLSAYSRNQFSNECRIVAGRVNLESPAHLQNQTLTEQIVPYYAINEFDKDLTEDQSLSANESYINHTKKIRREINRRYYLKRKKKIQLETGTVDRVIIKNEAYMKKRARNRRYYLKRKQKLSETRNEIDGSSNSQSSLQSSNYYSNLSNDNQYEDQTGTISEFIKSESDEVNLENFRYNATDNETREKCSNLDEVANVNYTQFHDHMFRDWVQEEEQFGEGVSDYANDPFQSLPDDHNNLKSYSNETARKRRERNRRYYLKRKEKLNQQKLEQQKE